MSAPGVTTVRVQRDNATGARYPAQDPIPPPRAGPGRWAQMIMSGMRGRSPARRRGCLVWARCVDSVDGMRAHERAPWRGPCNLMAAIWPSQVALRQKC